MITSTVAVAILALSQLTNGGSTNPVETAIKIVSDPRTDAVLHDIAKLITDTIVTGADIAEVLNLEALAAQIASVLTSMKDYCITKVLQAWDFEKSSILSWIGAGGGDSTGVKKAVNDTKKEIEKKILQYLREKLIAKQVAGFTVEYIDDVVIPTVQEC